MTSKPSRNQFEELAIPRREVPKLSSRYRVYTDARNFVSVEADNALEALKKSGLQSVSRIERDSIFLNAILDLDRLSNNPAPAAQAVAQAPVAEAAPATPPATETQAPPLPEAAPAQPAAVEPAADAPLSSAEVDNLLKGENATGA